MTTLIADPRIVAVAMDDNHEPLVDLPELGISYAGVPKAGLGSWVRHGVGKRLVAADAALPVGVRLLVIEGLRSATAQAAVIADYTTELRARFPWHDELEIRRLSTRYVAPLEVAPHIAGAAVDLTLADSSGQPLWMGTAVDATPEASDGACNFAATNIDPRARRNRTVLAEVMTGAGLVNYPTEWWHWSFGDRYWAYVTGADHACYGPVPEATSHKLSDSQPARDAV